MFRWSWRLALLALAMFCARTSAAAGDSDKAARKALRGVHRIVFLGDSITEAGDYIVDCECWLLAHNFHPEVLDLGLGSETASNLTPEENRGHLQAFGFARPFVSERLGRALSAARPDLLFVCYGMNDAAGLPPGESGTQRYAEAITELRQAALKAGVKRVVLCTPPVYDDFGQPARRVTDENLARYTTWLISKRADGWDVVNVHTPMRQALDAAKAKDPNFRFAPDGVHPGRAGHWLMAREILTQFFGANLSGVESAEDIFPAHGAEIRELVRQRKEVLFAAWMTKIGHQRPGVPGGPDAKPGLPVPQAEAQAADITKKVRALLVARGSALSGS